MADNCAATLNASPAKASASDKEANKATKRELTKSTNLLTVKVHITGKHMAHVYDQTFDLRSKQPWFLRQNRGTSAIGEPLTVQIGARSFLAYVPDGDDNRVFDIEIPAWMRTYLADQVYFTFELCCERNLAHNHLFVCAFACLRELGAIRKLTIF